MNDTKNPTRWLTTLLEEAKSFDGSMFPPVEKVDPERDTKVGDCPEELRPYWSYARYCEREMKQAKLEIEYTSSEDEKVVLKGKFSDMYSRNKTLNFIFWSCLNDHMANWPTEFHMGIREGWVVVSYKNESLGMPDFFGRLFGRE